MHQAVRASSIRMAKPGDTDPFAQGQVLDACAHGIDSPDDLVSRNDRDLGIRKLAVHDMQIRTADAASQHLDPDFLRTRFTIRQFHPLEWSLEFLQNHCMHVKLRAGSVVHQGSDRAGPPQVGPDQTPLPPHRAARHPPLRPEKAPCPVSATPIRCHSAHHPIQP